MTQLDVAKTIGTTQRKISHWESGKIEPDIESLCKIADLFSVSVDYLIGRSDY